MLLQKPLGIPRDTAEAEAHSLGMVRHRVVEMGCFVSPGTAVLLWRPRPGGGLQHPEPGNGLSCDSLVLQEVAELGALGSLWSGRGGRALGRV